MSDFMTSSGRHPAKMAPKVAIVSTVADAERHLEFFLQYHIQIGFCHFFIFIDDCCPKTLQIAKSYANVTPILNNNRLTQLWRQTPAYRNTISRCLLKREVMARQELNVFVAESLAKSIEIDWLLHIDLDELFYLNGASFTDHFNTLTRKDAGGFCYLNYEAIPTKDSGIQNIYTASYYFRKNYFKKGHWFFSKAQREIIDKNHWLKKHFFNYYQNGKSAANLHYSLIVDDVHSMRGATGRVMNGGHGDPIILHFPCMNLAEFKRKYDRLGSFDNLWRGLPRAGKFIDTIHLTARDIYATGDLADFTDLYRKHFQMDAHQIKTLLGNDLAVEIHEVKKIISSLNGGNWEAERKINLSEFPGDSKWLKGIFVQQSRGFSDQHCEYRGTFTTINLLKFVPNAESYISFLSLAEARKWLRRHPLLKKRNTTAIRYCHRRRSYVVELDSHPLTDWSKEEAVLAVAKLIESKLKKYECCILYNLGNCFFKTTNGHTEFDHEHERLKLACQITVKAGSDLSRRIGLVLPSTLERYVVPVQNNNAFYLDLGLTDAIQESFRKNTALPLAIFLSERYPRSNLIQWAVCDVQFYHLTLSKIDEPCFSHKATECQLALLLTLSRLVLLGPTVDSPIESIQSLLMLKDRYQILFQHQPRQLYAEHPNIILLKIESKEYTFIALFNITTELAYMSKLQLDKAHLSKKWRNLLSDCDFIFSSTGFVLNGYEYLWLISPTN